MPEQTSSIISKVWGMCGPLRDDGVSYGDYLEQLTYLIFLKMSDEYSRPPLSKAASWVRSSKEPSTRSPTPLCSIASCR